MYVMYVFYEWQGVGWRTEAAGVAESAQGYVVYVSCCAYSELVGV